MTPEQIGKLFDDNYDCITVDNHPAMNRKKFIEVVSDIADSKRKCNNCEEIIEPISLGEMCPACCCNI